MAFVIKALLSFGKLSPAALLERARAIYEGMKDNPAYRNPPVDMERLGRQIETYTSLVTEAMDGSRTVIAARNREGAILIKMLKQLGQYVEVASDGDWQAFYSSRFQPAPTTRRKTPPVSEAIRKIVNGLNQGDVRIRFVAVSGADSYQMRCAIRQADGTPGEWTTHSFAATKRYLTFNSLTPGVFYLFQVRALKGMVFTDWSDPVTFMPT